MIVPMLELLADEATFQVQPNLMKARPFIPIAILAVALAGCSSSESPKDSVVTPKPGETKPAVAMGDVQELKIETVTPGKGDGAKSGDMLTMMYRGTLMDGTVFDGNMDEKGEPVPGKPPFALELGIGMVIKGWDDGLVGIKVGETRKLLIPSELGYGAQGQGQIPPNADLAFSVKCLDIVKKGEEMIIDTTDVKEGSGPEVKKGDKVTIHYVGTLVNGKQFDSSRDKNEPFTFEVGARMVVPGFDKGVMGMKKGGIRKLRLPPDAAYGADATGGIPPNSVLLFEIELLKINGK